MMVKLMHPGDATVARRAKVLAQIERFYPFGMKALAWGIDVRINDFDFEDYKRAFKAEGLELVEA